MIDVEAWKGLQKQVEEVQCKLDEISKKIEGIELLMVHNIQHPYTFGISMSGGNDETFEDKNNTKETT